MGVTQIVFQMAFISDVKLTNTKEHERFLLTASLAPVLLAHRFTAE